MAESSKTYVKALLRHQRILIFVDSQIGEKSLRAIMEANLHNWGGRYNPIVPVYDNVVNQGWLDLIKHFDPDYIYYSKKISLGFLKSLSFFQPKEYIEYRDDDNRYDFPGVNIHYMLHELIEDSIQGHKLSLLQYNGKWSMNFPAKEFYQLNLGFKPLFADENKWLGKYKLIGIDENNAAKINQLICENRPYFKTALAARHINSICLNANNDWQVRQFEWIIYQPDNYVDDLLYFWNRQLYVEPGNKLNHVISTVDEFNELLSDSNFEGLLYCLSLSYTLTIVSKSLSENDLSGINTKAQAKCNSIRIQVKEAQTFPFDAHGFKYISSQFLKQSNNLILGKTDFLRLPSLSFESGDVVKKGFYVVDTVIERSGNDEHNEIKFPYGTPLYHLICKEPGRINKLHRASIYLSNDAHAAEFSVPSDTELIMRVLTYREHQKELLTLPVEYLSYSNSGKKLSAFYNLFDGDWPVIKQFLEEKFWLELFTYHSDVKDSNIPNGKGIFNYKDLENEIEGLFEKYNHEIIQDLSLRSEDELGEELIARIIERDKKQIFDHYIKPELKYLITKGALLMGMKVRCEQCGSNKWYSLNELNDKINCKGCNSPVIPNIDSGIYYKLSDIVINNLKSDQTRNSKQYDGNYVVMKTLISLKFDVRYSGNSFIWSPHLDFTTDRQNGAWSSDLDILAIQNGELIIGEAKNRSKDFNNKEINQLTWVANNLMPDKIIVACNSGNLQKVIEKIKSGINRSNCEIISYKAGKPWYHFTGLFGLPHENDETTAE